jgi:hypothetical protein
MGLKDLFKSWASSPTVLPYLLQIPNNNTDDPQGLAGEFEPQQHYFTVRVNEMFLSERRKWLKEIEPMVVCLTSYIYGEQEIDNPFIVGRNLIETKMQNIPEGMIFQDTRVAGIHPFAGGRLIVSIALCHSVTKDYLADSLDFIEKISGVFNENITTLIGNYTKIANVVIGGIDKLFDSNSVKPLFGFRKEFDPDANDHFSPGYYLMIDRSDSNWNPNNFFVKNNRLFYGNDKTSAKEFRKDEYVLFSVTRSDERGDIKLLSVYQSYKKILDVLKVDEVTQDTKDKIKDMLRVLNIEMQQSPDLTEPQAKALIQKYITEVGLLIEPKFNWGASSDRKPGFWSDMDDKIMAL